MSERRWPPEGQRPVRALLADPALLAMLATQPGDLRVHSAFTHVVNLARRSRPGDLWTVAARGLPGAPNTMVVDTAELAAWDLRRDQPGRSADGLLRLADAVVDLRTARPWSPRLPDLARLVASGPQRLDEVLRVLDDVLSSHGIPGGLLPAPDAGRIDAEVTATLMRRADTLRRAVADGDVAAVLGAGGALVGLGPGLTPAGDDFLTGLLALCAPTGLRLHDWLPVLAQVVERGRSRTTDVSAATLVEAVRGRLSDVVADLLEALTGTGPGPLAAATTSVLGIGRTSGTDIVSGLRAGLRLEKELRGWT